ncbi:piggyBac transposable element-derived protein 3-like [Seriola aureovittata]|uniref:piggyBac transposable element-derived protein 3-like n=1 Tax=Seriola aureovittata TaxID=2871759 RepID=UPI0024BEF5BC|nr:piggyBac transposable element-derived protein 3-like [Seriola aureovittata]XP_056229120.1 piggyBac transposable element-derived protein 3-like [Seriola aureovittata]
MERSLPESTGVMEPVNYFRQLFHREVIEDVVRETNLYALQCNVTRPLNATVAEMEQFIGVCFYMSVHGLPKTRLYWNPQTRVEMVANTITVNRWENIKRYLHFADNNNQAPGGDKLFKVRPLLNFLKDSFNKIPMDEMLCVDEQMVPFKGKSQLKQYIPMKPKRWGYKFFILADQHGIVYNFDVYTGSIQPHPGFPDIGASGNIVLQLASAIPTNISYKLFFDNWFCSVDLQVLLEKKKIHSVGTVRQNRLAGCTFMDDGAMKAKGRGTHQEKMTIHDGVTLWAVKWFDNCPVTLLSTFVGANPTTEVQRWDKKKKEMIRVPRPNIVSVYNKSMGGVDLLDSLIALYRTKIRSKKRYHRIVFHMLDLTLEAWLLYRRDCQSQIPENAQLPLLDFKLQVATCLCMENKVSNKRKGRPSQVVVLEKKKRGRPSFVPSDPIRKDNTDHWPL